MARVGGSFKRVILSSVSTAALFCGTAIPSLGYAQEVAGGENAEPAAPATPAQGGADVAEIVVTGSRVKRAGFDAPTPTTVVSAETLEKLGSTDVGSALQQLPAFQADQNGSTNPLGSSAGRRYANLRNLGSQRTLVLQDSQRLAPSALTGQTDLNVVPTILIDRVDVVTGGASAQWGSDAVAGVVNIITKKSLEGFKTDLSFGDSDRGDNEERHAGLAYGTSFGGSNAHFIVGGEYVDNNGVGDLYTRGWGREEWGFVNNTNYATNGGSKIWVLPNVRRSNLAAGGLITSGPLAGTTFDENGQPRQFQYGSIVGSGTMSGGDGYADGDGQGTPLKPPVERGAVQARIGYDLTPTTEIYAQANYASVLAKSLGPGPIDYSGAGLVIKSGNPYIPTSIQSAMDAQGIDSFTMGRYWKDDVYGDSSRLARPTTKTKTQAQTYTVGANGAFGDSWSWDTYAQYARSTVQYNGYGYRLNGNFYKAIDAVTDDNGSIVCRSTLTDPGDGCVPINLFGRNSVTPEAYAYITGNPHNRTVLTRDVEAINLHGDPLSTWAGPISIATGIERRSDDAKVIQHDPLALSGAYNYGNTKPISGSVSVFEGYFEAVVPLLADKFLVKSLDFDGAVRQTHYSTSGAVTTWKLGLNYAIDDNVRLRTSWSQDIRAPNVSELYTAQSTGTTNIINPATGGNLTATTVSSGNTDLDPESAHTLTAGFVLTPEFLHGFRFSADYYDINIKDVISSVGAQTIVNFCAQGAASYCSLVTYNTAETATVQLPYLNLAGLHVQGVDMESAYGLDLGSLSSALVGRLDFNLFMTYQAKMEVDNGTSTVDRAGDMGSSSSPYGGPKWKSNLLATYSLERFSGTVGLRYVGDGKKDVTYTSADIDNNHVASVTYVSLALGYDLPVSAKYDVQLYGNVQNLFDRDPPVDPTSSSGGPYNATFHDVIGRTYMVGLKAQF